MRIYDPDDPLVLNGTYDTEGYKPGERARIAKQRQHAAQRKPQPRRRSTMKKNNTSDRRGTFAFVKSVKDVQSGIQTVVFEAIKKAKKGTVAEIAAVAVKLGLKKATSQDPLVQTHVHLNRLKALGAVRKLAPASGGAR